MFKNLSQLNVGNIAFI